MEFFACKSSLSHAMVEVKLGTVSVHLPSCTRREKKKKLRTPETDTALQMVMNQWGALLAIQKGNTAEHPLRK